MVPQIDPILEGKLFQAVGPEVESKVRKNGETELREPPLLYYKKVGLEAIVLTGFWREDGDLIGRDLYEPGVLIIPGKNKTEQLLRIEQLLNDTTFPKRLKEHTLKPAFEELKFKDRGKPKKDIIRFVLRGNPGVDGDLGFVVCLEHRAKLSKNKSDSRVSSAESPTYPKDVGGGYKKHSLITALGLAAYLK